MHEMAKQWYGECIYALAMRYNDVRYDDLGFRWFLIVNYEMPPIFTEQYSALLVTTPAPDIDNHEGYSFYMNKMLKRWDGQEVRHLIDNVSYNPHTHQGYCRLSYHLKSFRPAYPISTGDTFLDICNSVHVFLQTDWNRY